VPYLPAQEDPYDGWDGNSVHAWAVTVDLGRLERSHPAVGSLRRLRVTNRDGNGDWQGRVESLVLEGTKGSVTISGDAFRWAFGLRSSWFTIEPTPIMSRWSRIGGPESPVGEVRGAEFAVGRGSAQRFERGRIFHSRATGARELYGPVLRRYRRTGGPSSVLGFPRTPVRTRPGVNLARFQNGSVYHRVGHAAVAVSGAIDKRYVKMGGLGSRLGRPTRTNFAVKGGERANFEHGFIRWFRASGRTRVRVTG
jgi:stage II sporulation protein D